MGHPSAIKPPVERNLVVELCEFVKHDNHPEFQIRFNNDQCDSHDFAKAYGDEFEVPESQQL